MSRMLKAVAIPDMLKAERHSNMWTEARDT